MALPGFATVFGLGFGVPQRLQTVRLAKLRLEQLREKEIEGEGLEPYWPSIPH